MNIMTTAKQLKISLHKYYIHGIFLALNIANPSLARAAEGTTVATVAENITSTFSSLTKLITGGAYVVGFSLTMVGVLKLKAHKDNPTQIPISTGLALIFVGAALVFLPNLLGVGATTIFGDAVSEDVSACGTDKLVIS